MRLMDYILNFNIEVFYKIYPQVLNLAQFCHYNPQINCKKCQGKSKNYIIKILGKIKTFNMNKVSKNNE